MGMGTIERNKVNTTTQQHTKGNTMKPLIENFCRYRMAGVPVVVVNTSDASETTRAITSRAIIEGVEAEGVERPKVTERETAAANYEWDALRGLRSLNDRARAEIATIANEPARLSGKPDLVLRELTKANANTVVFLQMKPEWFGLPEIRQGIQNIRDEYKANFRMLVIVGQGLAVPHDLTNDVLTIDDELPSRESIKTQVAALADTIGCKPTGDDLELSADALQGMTAFAVEQIVSTTIKKTGIDHAGLWNAKKKAIGQSKGLSIFEDGTTFADIVGLDVLKDYLFRVLNGNNRPNAVVYIDEIDKSINNRTSDTSGVALNQLQQVLETMQNTNARGVLLLGVPGVGKSAVAKATGNAGRIPTMKLDFGGAKGSLVGQSENQFAEAIQKITAIGGGRTLWVATCNSIEALPLELRSRFGVQFFVDVPTPALCRSLWKTYIAKKGIKENPPENLTNWTGREVKACCEIAFDLGCSLADAANFVVPICDSSMEDVERIRNEANGRFLDANTVGRYIKRDVTNATTNNARAFENN